MDMVMGIVMDGDEYGVLDMLDLMDMSMVMDM